MTASPPPATPPIPEHGDWIQTQSGVAFDLQQPLPGHVRLSDIAHALSLQCRFGGHISRHYSIAQHSLNVAHLLRLDGHDATVCLQGLLHDATEAYVIDVPRPLKRMLSGYKAIEDRVWQAIATAFGVPVVLHPAVKNADEVALAMEAHTLLPGGPTGDWCEQPNVIVPATLYAVTTPELVRDTFIGTFHALNNQR